MQETTFTCAEIIVFAATLARRVVSLLVAMVAGWLIFGTILWPHTYWVARVCVEHQTAGTLCFHWPKLVAGGFAVQEVRTTVVAAGEAAGVAAGGAVD